MLTAIGQNKDKESFIALYEHFAPRVKSYLMKGGLPENNADELAQDTMLSVWDKAALFDSARATASTWIFTLARNKKIDRLRKGGMYMADISTMPELESGGSDAASDLMAAEATETLARELEKLPADQADLLQKSFFEDKSHGEIAAETGLPLGTIKSRIRLALNRLRQNEQVRQLW